MNINTRNLLYGVAVLLLLAGLGSASLTAHAVNCARVQMDEHLHDPRFDDDCVIPAFQPVERGNYRPLANRECRLMVDPVHRTRAHRRYLKV